VRHARLYGRAFQAKDVINKRSLSKSERDALQNTVASGINDGVFYPLCARFNRISLMAVIGDPELVDEVQLDQLHFLSIHFYKIACTFDPCEEGSRPIDEHGVLTHRERECLTWIANGKTDLEIADQLGISKRTVRFHIENSMEKLDASSRLHAVMTALRNIEIFL
jgi:DNA-binding CsgD family transcriptional regulator